MKKALKTQLVCISCLVAAAAVTEVVPASATTLAPWSGNPTPFSDASCFSNDYDSVTQNATCTGNRSWHVDLPVNSGTYDPEIFYDAELTSGGMSCEVIGISADHATKNLTGYIAAGKGSGWQSFKPAHSVGGEAVPANGDLIVACQLGSNAELGSIGW